MGALLYLVQPTASLPHPQLPRVAASPVESFSADHVPIVDALLQLGREQHVPMGIEYVDLAAVEEPISVSLQHVTLARVLDVILSSRHGYVWRFADGVVVVSHQSAPAGTRNLFDFVLPAFSIRRCTLQEANQALALDLYVALHPETKGIIGNYSPGNSSTMVGPLNMRAVTVRHVLNRLVAQAGYAAWVAQVPPRHLGELPSTGLWRLVDFSAPANLREADLLRRNLRAYESQPSKR